LGHLWIRGGEGVTAYCREALVEREAGAGRRPGQSEVCPSNRNCYKGHSGRREVAGGKRGKGQNCPGIECLTHAGKGSLKDSTRGESAKKLIEKGTKEESKKKPPQLLFEDSNDLQQNHP